MDFTQFLNFFIGLLVISNPLSALPAVLRITSHQSPAQKKNTGLVTAFAVGIILLVVTWIGAPLLMILGIRLPAFQMAGGIILFMLSLSMLNAKESDIKHTEQEGKEKLPSGETGAIVPLAIPIIAGPGAISTIIVQMNEFPGVWNQILVSCSAVLVAFVMGILLISASHLEKLLGKSGINIINRLGGLILAAISIQTMANGILGLFPTLNLSR